MDRLIALVALRWRMELRALGRARERWVGVALLVPGLLVFSLFTSAAVFLGVGAVRRADPALVLPVLSVLATTAGLFWALSPLLAGVTFTESHDVTRLLHFPISPATLVASSFIANLAQPMALAELPVILSLSLALAGDLRALPLVLAGVAGSFLFILAVAQATGLMLQGLARNRRFHDLALFVSLGLGFALSVAPVLILSGGAGPLRRLLRALVRWDVFAASPFAWGARAAVHAGRGEIGPFAFFMAAQGAAVLAVLGLAALLIQRIHRGELNLGTGAGPSAGRARMRLPGDLGALVEKDLRSAWRDPALKATLFMGLFAPLLFLFFMSRGGASRAGRGVLILAMLIGISSYGANAFGLERRGVALLLGFPTPRWRILVGKNLGALFFRLPGLIALAVAAVVLAPPILLPAALTITFVTLFMSVGVDNYVAILFPVAAPEPGKSPQSGAGAGGRGLGPALLAAALMALSLLFAAPFVFLAWLPLWLEQPGLWLVTLPLALAGAGSVYGMLVAGAARLLERREPELLERILGEA